MSAESDPTTRDIPNLPYRCTEIEQLKQKCKHCGDLIEVVTPLYLIGSNGSAFCDPNKQTCIDNMHEIVAN